MNVRRIAKHMLTTPGQLRRALPRDGLDAVQRAIAASEARHAGQIRFAAEAGLDVMPLIRGLSARDRAIELFSALRVWDTEHNIGVLIYLLFADHSIEIVADRGIHREVGDVGMRRICEGMEIKFRSGSFVNGIVSGIEELTRHLEAHFPPGKACTNELPDKPLLLP